MLSAGQAEGLDDLQRTAVAALAGQAGLVVIEGAAGAGKTTTLAATKAVLSRAGPPDAGRDPDLEGRPGRGPRGRHRGFGGLADPPARLPLGRGRPLDPRGLAEPVPEAVLGGGDLLLVDEAGMLDQDTARALLTVADEMGARVALVGDRHQLPAVGRGGVLDLAARWVPPEAHVDLDVAHRFADPEYAAISLALRTGSPTYTVPGDATDARSGERSGERSW